MCDFSLEHVRQRDAVIGETLECTRSHSGTIGCLDRDEYGNQRAVCIKAGTKLQVTLPESVVGFFGSLLGRKKVKKVEAATFIHATGVFGPYRDALEFRDGVVLCLQQLEGAKLEVLDPAVKEIEAEALKETETEAVKPPAVLEPAE